MSPANFLPAVVMSQPGESNPQSSPSRLIRPNGSPSQKLSVDEFYDLSRQQLIGMDAPVELVKGEVCQLPTDERLNRQIRLLQRQIQQCLLATRGCEDLDVRSRQPLRIDEYCELKPAICIVKRRTVKSGVVKNGVVKNGNERPLWVMDVTQEGLNWLNTGRSQLWATADVAEYWSLTMSQAELRTYLDPTETGYQSCQLLHVGETVTPRAIRQLTFRVQEPLPLHFLTRTLGGQRRYETVALPLQVCSGEGQGGLVS